MRRPGDKGIAQQAEAWVLTFAKHLMLMLKDDVQYIRQGDRELRVGPSHCSNRALLGKVESILFEPALQSIKQERRMDS